MMQVGKHNVWVMPLKGVALLRLLYDDVGLRPMSDIDLLADRESLVGVQAAIEEAGFILAARSDREISYVYPPNRIVSWIGEHPDNPIKLELHLRVANRLRHENYDITSVVAGSGIAVCRGYPDRATLMLHLLHHAAAHMSECSLRFISLYDIHLVAQQSSEHDWRTLHDLLRMHNCLWWAYGPLALLQRYFPRDLPEWLINTTRAAAPARLRRAAARWTITSISFCNLSSRYVLQRLVWIQTNRHLMRYCVSYLGAKMFSFVDRLSTVRIRKATDQDDVWGLYPKVHEPRRQYLRRLFDVLSSNTYRWGAAEQFHSSIADLNLTAENV
jgi:hypothetical protein